MTLEVINVGAAPNDGTGDVWRDAWIKVNNNFAQTFNGPYVIGPPTSGITLTVNEGTLESNSTPGIWVTADVGFKAYIGIGANGTTPGVGSFDFQQAVNGNSFIIVRPAASLALWTNNVSRFNIAPDGAITVNPPTADSLSFNVFGSTNAANTHGAFRASSSNNVRIATFDNTTGSGGWICYAHNGADTGFWGDSATLLVGGATDDVCLRANNALDFGTGGTNRRIHISSTGNTEIFTPASGVTLTVDQGALDSGTNPGIRVSGDSGFGARISVCGNGSSPSINSFDLVQVNIGDVYIIQRSNHNMAFWTNNSPAFLADNFGQVFFYHAIAINGNTPSPQVTGWGTPVNPAVINNYNITDAGGANSNTNKAVAQIIKDLKAFGLYGT